jgi:GT2 family glycosyltransferase
MEPKPGLSNARNRAVTEAKGELLLWTDDDVLVDPDWLTEYATAARAWPQAGYFGGQILPWFEVKPPRWVLRHMDRVGYCWAVLVRDAAVRPMRPGEHAIGANMAFRTALLREFPFDPSLGRMKNSLIHGEDTDVQAALRQAGHLGIWVGTARVEHFVPASRMRLDYVWRFHVEGHRAAARKTDLCQPCPRLFGVPRWMLRRYWSSYLLAQLLRPLKNDRWIRAFVDSAQMRGFIIEASEAARREPMSRSLVGQS